MWTTRVRKPTTGTFVVSRQLRRSSLRSTAALGRRYYASNERDNLESHPPPANWFRNSLGLAVTATAAFLIYSYATRPDDSEFLKSLPDSSKSIEDLSAQYVQKKRGLKSPGIYLWGTNEYRVVDPESKVSVIKTPRRMPYFDGQVLRDLKLGETSGAAITESGDLVQWGKGFSGVHYKPTKTLTGKNLTSLSMSHDRILALSSDGNVYSLPISSHDQASGQKLNEKSWLPFWGGQAGISYRLIQPSLKFGEKVSSISGGLEHVLLLTSSGRVFSAAASTENYPTFGQLGIPGLAWATRPKGPVDICHEIKTPSGSKVAQIASGDYHSLMLTKEGEVLGFGDNSFGQLGMQFDPSLPFIDRPASVPIKTLYRDGSVLPRVTGVVAGGANSFFTVDVRQAGPTQDSKEAGKITSDIWTCGRGIWGALGNGKWTHVQDHLTKVKALSGLIEYDEATQALLPIRLNDISVGTTHVAAVLGNQAHLNSSSSSLEKADDVGLDVVWWGGNEHFQLGTGKRSNLSKPTHINIAPEDASDDDKELARLQILPTRRGTVGKRSVNMRQRVEIFSHTQSSPIMPRENQKRGRRAADKVKKDETKRKRDDAPEESETKRLKPSTDETPFPTGEDYIPLEENQNDDEVQREDMPFYGLLDAEEQEYFSRANEMLELNQFQDAEERRLFVDSVFREARGKELKIACSQSCSRLMEKLISVSDIYQIRRLFNKFIGHFMTLVQHRFASHCCERLFISAAPGVTQKISKWKGNTAGGDEQEDDDEPEPELSLAEMFMTVVEELQGNWGYLLTERFASHTIRVLLLVLAGEPIDVSSHESVVASRKKERLAAIGGETQETVPVPDKISVPESFETTLKKVMQDMVSVLDDTYLRALATHPVGNPVLQVLVRLELSHFGKSTAKQTTSITKRLIPDENFEEDSETVRFIRGLLYDAVGSRLLETIVRWMPGKMFKTLYKNYLREQLASLARNQTAGYVVLRVLERLGKDDLKAAVEQLAPKIPSLIERSRTIVPKLLVERCVVRGVDTKPLAKALEDSYDSDPARRLAQILKLEGETADKPESFNNAESNPTNPAAEKLHGSLLAQTMLTAPGPVGELIYSSLLATSPETLLNMCKDATASRVVQQALTSTTSSPQFRRQFTTRFTSHITDLSVDSCGSHVVDALWPATKDIYFIKERMAQELAQDEMTLRDSFVGRAVWRNWAMDLYKRRRGEWTGKAKGRDLGTESGEKPKSRLELARARYAAKSNDKASDLLIPFIRAADEDTIGPEAQKNGISKSNGDHTIVGTSLVDYKKPEELQSILQLDLPQQGTGQDGLIEVLRKVLQYSVNTWHQGFLDKLYASTNAPGVASELILAALNTNVHVYQVSPALSVIEKYTGQQLAGLFGFDGPRAGGISVQGGSASNTTSIVIARNNLYPTTKTEGNGDYKFVLFTSAHGHYSIEKAAQMLGMGSSAVWSVPIDKEGRMIPSELEKLVQRALSEKRTPFYVNATAGTTVMGSFDPFEDIAAICKKHNLWMHIDGSWGGSFAFSARQRHQLAGAEKADSIAINPHKMLGVPVTCSFLLASDVRQFHRANTLPAGYLFHTEDAEETGNGGIEPPSELEPSSPEIWDLADLTLQCGRRADSLKLFLSWTYYGTAGYERQIDTAYDTAAYLATLIQDSPNLILVSQNPPPCLQVCFYYAPNGALLHHRGAGVVNNETERAKANSKVTEQITHTIVGRGFMVDYAPPSGDEESVGDGKFFRCVVNVQTSRETIEGLVRAVEEAGPGVVEKLRGEQGVLRRPGERGHGPVVHRS
ncbi:hypothetical protein BJX99DRAFT_247813 [Aspergillus californicus]